MIDLTITDLDVRGVWTQRQHITCEDAGEVEQRIQRKRAIAHGRFWWRTYNRETGEVSEGEG